jgi:16S rRNA processing protein RimM
LAQPPEAWVWLARIRRPQGRKGEVFSDILTDFPEKFSQRRNLWLLQPESVGVLGNTSNPLSPGAPGPSPSGTGETNPVRQKALPEGAGSSHLGTAEATPAPPQARPVCLTNHWLHKGGIVLHFAGVDSISAAEALKGAIVAIPRAERATLATDETYIGDLVGCTLVDVSSASSITVGEIAHVDLPAGAAPLLVVRAPAGEVLVPFAKHYLRRIDLESRRVEMALPEGLADLNKTPS